MFFYEEPFAGALGKNPKKLSAANHHDLGILGLLIMYHRVFDIGRAFLLSHLHASPLSHSGWS